MQVRETDSILNEHPKSMTHLRGLKILVRRTTRADKRADGSFTVDLNTSSQDVLISKWRMGLAREVARVRHDHEELSFFRFFL